MTRALEEEKVNTTINNSGSVVKYYKQNELGEEIGSIKNQIVNSQEKLNTLDVVDNVVSPNMEGWKFEKKKEWILERLKSTGYSVERQGFGKISFDEKQIVESLRYTNALYEVAAFSAMPRVLKRGVLIHEHKNHKGRGHDTITIAAPVTINGVRGNMGVVVKLVGKNLYKTHRILMPDGSAFEYNNNAEPTTANGASLTRPHGMHISSASDITLSDSEENVNKKFSLPSPKLLNYQINNWRNTSEQQDAKSLQNQGFSDNRIIRRQQKIFLFNLPD